MTEVLEPRTTGQYPISIGTSLAIESFNGVNPEVRHPSPPVRRTQQLYLNSRTLLRNLMTSYPANTVFSEVELLQLLYDEMQVIATATREYNPALRVVSYLADPVDYASQFPLAKPREVRTERQLRTQAIEQWVLSELFAQETPGVEKQVFKHGFRLDRSSPETVVLTHISADLFGAARADRVSLLESRTGALKPEAQWYTKYYNSKDLPPLPFRADFMSVLGDSTLFSPMPVAYRRALVDLAIKFKWTAITTYERIRYCADSIPDQGIRSEFKDRILTNQW